MTQNKNEMIVLGITGGIGSGKSLVLHKLEQLPDTVILILQQELLQCIFVRQHLPVDVTWVWLLRHPLFCLL